MEENVILVDESDNEIGCIGKTEAHRKALLHRAVSVFIFNSAGEWLLQRRALSKYHSGGLWTNSSCTHPLPDENNSDAANRRLEQEMGIQCQLKEAFSFIYRAELDNGLTEHELDHVFIGISDMPPVINRDEVEEFCYVNFRELKSDIQINADNYTAWFLKIYEQVQAHFLNTKLYD